MKFLFISTDRIKFRFDFNNLHSWLVLHLYLKITDFPWMLLSTWILETGWRGLSKLPFMWWLPNLIPIRYSLSFHLSHKRNPVDFPSVLWLVNSVINLYRMKYNISYNININVFPLEVCTNYAILEKNGIFTMKRLN